MQAAEGTISPARSALRREAGGLSGLRRVGERGQGIGRRSLERSVDALVGGISCARVARADDLVTRGFHGFGEVAQRLGREYRAIRGVGREPTVARWVTRLTLACSTPGTVRRALSTRRTQLAQPCPGRCLHETRDGLLTLVDDELVRGARRAPIDAHDTRSPMPATTPRVPYPTSSSSPSAPRTAMTLSMRTVGLPCSSS